MSAPPVTKRPFAERVIFWGLLLLALWNLGRAAALLPQMDWVAGLELVPDPRLRLGLSGGWAILFLGAALALWHRSSWIRRSIPLLMALFGVYELGMMIAFATEPPAPLLAIAYAAFVCFSGWALWRPQTGGLHSRQ